MQKKLNVPKLMAKSRIVAAKKGFLVKDEPLMTDTQKGHAKCELNDRISFVT